LIVFIAGMAGFTAWSMIGVETGLKVNGHLGTNTVAVIELERNVIDMRRNVDSFVQTAEQIHANQVIALNQHVYEGLERMAVGGGGESVAQGNADGVTALEDSAMAESGARTAWPTERTYLYSPSGKR
jgi:hypothetical protein